MNPTLFAELTVLTIEHMAERAGVTFEEMMIAIITQDSAKARLKQYMALGVLELKKHSGVA